MNGVSEEVPVLRLHCACGVRYGLSHSHRTRLDERDAAPPDHELFGRSFLNRITHRTGDGGANLRTEPTHRDARTRAWREIYRGTCGGYRV